VLGRGGDHLLEQLAVARLQLLALDQGGACSGDPIRECIPHPLELVEAGHARLSEAAGDLGIDLEARKGLRAQPRQLMLEPADLAPQLSTSKPLIASNPKRSQRLVFKQARHRTRVECRSPSARRKREPR